MLSQHTVYLIWIVFSTRQFAFLTKKNLVFGLSSETG